MVTSPSPGRSDFFAVELSDGDLYALFNLGGRTQRFLVGSGFSPSVGLKPIAYHGKPILKLRSVTCHMGSHSVTCYLTGQCASLQPQLDRLILDLPTSEGWKAELT